MRITSLSFADRSPYWSLQIMHIYLHSLSLVFPGPYWSAAWNQWPSVSHKAQVMNLVARWSDPTLVWGVPQCPPSTPVRLKHECEGNSPPQNPSAGKYIIHFGSVDPFFNWMRLTSLRVLWKSPVRGPRLDLSWPLHVSMGLWTMLFGVSGNCDDREVTSLAEEFPKEPDSEKDTYERRVKKMF